jgi:hypothetical protein
MKTKILEKFCTICNKVEVLYLKEEITLAHLKTIYFIEHIDLGTSVIRIRSEHPTCV